MIMAKLEKQPKNRFTITLKSGYFDTLARALCAMVDRKLSFKRIENVIKSIYEETGVLLNSEKTNHPGYPSAAFLETIF